MFSSFLYGYKLCVMVSIIIYMFLLSLSTFYLIQEQLNAE